MKKILTFILICMICSTLCIPARAYEKPITLTYAVVDPQERMIVGEMAKAFKTYVEELSENTILIDILEVPNDGFMGAYTTKYFGYSRQNIVGPEENILNELILQNSIDIGCVYVSTLVDYVGIGCDKAKLIIAPYMFSNNEHFWNFVDSNLAQEFLLEPQEAYLLFHGLCYGEEGFRNFFFRNKVEKLEDLKDLILRVPNNSIEMDIASDFGAEAEPLAWSETGLAINTGVFDGSEETIGHYNVENPLIHRASVEGFPDTLPEIAPHLLLDGHTVEAVEIIVSDVSWEKLNDKQRDLINEAARHASQVCREKLAKTEAQALESLRKDGVTITEVPDKTPWRNACQNTINKCIAGQEDLYQQILDLQYQSAEPSVSAAPANSQTGTIYCPECGQQIAATSKFCMYCGYKIPSVSAPAGQIQKPVLTPTPTPTPVPKTWSSWSSWSTTPAYSSSTREVETRTTVKGYNMFHYRTQYRDAPYPRVFRDYSINGDYDWKYSRRSYGEKYMEKYVTADQLAAATTYSPDSRNVYKGKHPGYQDGTTIAYGFKDDEFMWFIRSKDTVTEYRYRDLK